MPHTYEVQVRRADMDAFNHVNNVVYLTYLDEARKDLLTGRVGSGDVTRSVVVAKHKISYLRPLVHRAEPVRVESSVTHIGGSSFTVEHAIRDDETVYCRAESVLVTFDPVAGASRPLTEGERGALATYA